MCKSVYWSFILITNSENCNIEGLFSSCCMSAFINFNGMNAQIDERFYWDLICPYNFLLMFVLNIGSTCKHLQWVTSVFIK